MMRSATISDSKPRTPAPAITVAGSAHAAQWLSRIAQQNRRPWQVRQLRDGDVPQGLLVLTQPGDFPESLRHWIAAHQVVVSMDCPLGRSLALSNRVQTFTFSEGRDAADLTAKDLRLTDTGRLRFVAYTRSSLTRVLLDDPDDLYPALATLACAAWLGVPPEAAGEVISAPGAFCPRREVKMA